LKITNDHFIVPFASAQASTSTMDVIYFWFSVISLIIRTFYMLLKMAEVFEESKLPLKVFRNISLVAWCPEVRKLIYCNLKFGISH
jgi:hypothetical protein